MVSGNRILVQQDKNGREYALPGGHIKIGETLEAGLIREFQEETGACVHVRRLLWSEECFWEWKGKQAHNLAFYFLMDACGDLPIPEDGTFVSLRNTCDVVIGWMDLAQLQDITVYLEFLKTEVRNLDGPIRHFVSRG